MTRTIRHWTTTELARLRDLIAQGHNARQLATMFDRTQKSIIRIVAAHQLGPWHSPRGPKASVGNQIPGDFAECWATRTNAELARHYGRSTVTIGTWVRKLGLVRSSESRIRGRPAKIERPAEFDQWAPGKTVRQIAEHCGVSLEVARRFRVEAGIPAVKMGRPRIAAVPSSTKPWRSMTAPVDRPHVDMTTAGRAAEYLRRFGPVVRCNEAGRYDPAGTFWRRGGGGLLSDAEIVERAEFNGWAADAWKRVA